VKIESATVKALRITEFPGLDPVMIILQDVASGKGRLIIECYGEAWALFWGAMGEENTIGQFIAKAPQEYIAEKLTAGLRLPARKQAYVRRIALAVQAAITALYACPDLRESMLPSEEIK
jgi:hypothetical protein